MLKQVHLYIKGDVIGVGFRAWTKIQAKIHRVNGWVRNVYDRRDIFGPRGGVEAVLQGEEEDVDKMISTIKKGFPLAYVSHVEVFPESGKEIFEEFRIKK